MFCLNGKFTISTIGKTTSTFLIRKADGEIRIGVGIPILKAFVET